MPTTPKLWTDTLLAQVILAACVKSPPPEIEVTARGDSERRPYDIYYGPQVDALTAILDEWFDDTVKALKPTDRIPSFPSVHQAIDAVLDREPSFRGVIALDRPADWRGLVFVRESALTARAA